VERSNFEVELDRGAAIARAIAAAGVRDTVLLAGKGHEPYQEIAGVRHAFSDVAAAQIALQSWGARA
jgi:UDP-N-acetylmuramoyl-L-alanyl-D-glutamate--2,6-diaminopimelate ligase